MNGFTSVTDTIGTLAAGDAAAVITAATDIALVMDEHGTIVDVAMPNEELTSELGSIRRWLGCTWSDSVTAESRVKVARMLQSAIDQREPRWQQVNHPAERGADVPVIYSTVRLGDRGHVVALGRDLRAVSALQQRLITAQQAIERDYLRLREVETRYRLLFEQSTEAFIVLDVASLKPIEVNPAARALLEADSKRFYTQSLPDVFDAASVPAVEALFAGVRALGRPDTATAMLRKDGMEVRVCATMFRQENASFFLVRLDPIAASLASPSVSPEQMAVLSLAERAPDAIVVTAGDGRILTLNDAFLQMAQLSIAAQAQGQSIEQWLGRGGVDLNVLIASLKHGGSVRLFATSVLGEHGGSTDVEISATALPHVPGRNNDETDSPSFGFLIRNVGRRLAADFRTPNALPRSVEQLTQLIGRMSLKDIAREATDVIERLCIEAALELTDDNRASAADILGLSRQSLYVKLRKFGLGDLPGDRDRSD